MINNKFEKHWSSPVWKSNHKFASRDSDNDWMNHLNHACSCQFFLIGHWLVQTHCGVRTWSLAITCDPAASQGQHSPFLDPWVGLEGSRGGRQGTSRCCQTDQSFMTSSLRWTLGKRTDGSNTPFTQRRQRRRRRRLKLLEDEVQNIWSQDGWRSGAEQSENRARTRRGWI